MTPMQMRVVGLVRPEAANRDGITAITLGILDHHLMSFGLPLPPLGVLKIRTLSGVNLSFQPPPHSFESRGFSIDTGKAMLVLPFSLSMN